MNSLSKILIVTGGVLILVGVLWHFGGKFFPLGRLPGDIAIKKEGMQFYFPIMSCLVVSVILTVIGFIVNYFKK